MERSIALSEVQQDPQMKGAIWTLEIPSSLGTASSGIIICQ